MFLFLKKKIKFQSGNNNGKITISYKKGGGRGGLGNLKQKTKLKFHISG